MCCITELYSQPWLTSLNPGTYFNFLSGDVRDSVGKEGGKGVSISPTPFNVRKTLPLGDLNPQRSFSAKARQTVKETQMVSTVVFQFISPVAPMRT